MAVSVTNQRESQSLDGQSAIVLLNAADAAKLSQISVGQACVLDSNAKAGAVCSVDQYGHTFKMNPRQPNFNLASDSTPGYLAAGEVITIG